MDFGRILTQEYISLFGFLILFVFVVTNKKIEHNDKKLFFGIIALGILEIITFEAEDCLAKLPYPTFMRVFCSVVGYILRPALVAMIILLVDRRLRTKKRIALLLIPLVICSLVVTTAFYSHLCFWYTEENNNFMRGVLGYVPHIICILYTFVCLFVTCRQLRKQEKLSSLVLVCAALCPVFAIALDLIVRDTGLSRISIMLCTLIMYIQCHSMALTSMIDEIPGATAKFVVKNKHIKLVMFNELMCHVFGLSYAEFISATRNDPFAVLDEKARQTAKEAVGFLDKQDTHSFRLNISSQGTEKIIKVSLRVSRRSENEIEFYATMIDVTTEARLLDELSVKNHEISLMMNQLGKVICIYDIPTKTLSMSEQYAKLRGFNSTTAIVPDETNERKLVGTESTEAYNDFYRRILAGEHSGNVIVRLINPDGGDRWEKTDFITVMSEDGKPTRAVISIEDITKAYKKKLLLDNYRSTIDGLMGEKRYCLLLDLSECKVLAGEGGLLPQNLSVEDKTLDEITEYLISRYIKKKDSEIIREFLNADQMLSSYKANVMQRYIERDFIMPDNTERWFRINLNLDSMNDGKIMATLLFEDIDSEYRQHNVLIARANYDSLTGVLTREATMENVEQYLSGEGKNGTHALVMMDMDNLKSVNDKLGHQFGDMALKNFASNVKQFFQEDDIVGRIGGDEFFAFVKNISGPVLAKKLQLLLHSLEQIYSDKDKNITVTASAGVAMYHGDRTVQVSLKELYSKADAGLYQSKARGKNTYTFADEIEASLELSSSPEIKNDLISYNMKDVLDNLADGILIFHGKVGQNDVTPAYCNEKLHALLNIDYMQLFTHFSKDNNYGIHPDDVNAARASIREAIQTGNSIRRMFRIKKSTGEYICLTVLLNVRHTENSAYDIFCIFSNAESTD